MVRGCRRAARRQDNSRPRRTCRPVTFQHPKVEHCLFRELVSLFGTIDNLRISICSAIIEERCGQEGHDDANDSQLFFHPLLHPFSKLLHC
ncbi:hypothetical protein D3C80_1882500 [compost metagenome]